MALFLGALEYVLEEGNRWDWFQDETDRLGRRDLRVVAGVLFFWRMLTRRDPLVELRAFANANFAFGSLFSFVLGIGLYGSVLSGAAVPRRACAATTACRSARRCSSTGVCDVPLGADRRTACAAFGSARDAGDRAG